MNFIFLNVFGKNSQVVASRHLPQHGSQEVIFPSQTQTQEIEGPSIPGGQIGRNRVSSSRGQIGGMLPDTVLPPSKPSTPNLHHLGAVGRVEFLVVSFPRGGAEITNSQHFKSRKSNLPEKKSTCLSKVKGWRELKKAESMRSVNVWYQCAHLWHYIASMTTMSSMSPCSIFTSVFQLVLRDVSLSNFNRFTSSYTPRNKHSPWKWRVGRRSFPFWGFSFFSGKKNSLKKTSRDYIFHRRLFSTFSTPPGTPSVPPRAHTSGPTLRDRWRRRLRIQPPNPSALPAE